MPRTKPLVTIPDPLLSVESLRASVLALKELAEILGGQRGRSDARAVTWADLVALGLATDTEQPARQPVPSPGFQSFIYWYDGAITAPPPSAVARFDDAIPLNATKLWLSGTTNEGIDILNYFRLITISRVLVQQANDSSKWLVYDTTAAHTVVSGYVQIPIEMDTASGDQLDELPQPGQNILVAVN